MFSLIVEANLIDVAGQSGGRQQERQERHPLWGGALVFSGEVRMVRLSQGAEFMKLGIVQPNQASVYDYFAIKDIFTTFDGSWEPNGNIFAVPRWARETYLRSIGTPEYFDDAGGATHLFIRVEDENSKPLRIDAKFSTTGDLVIRVDTGAKRSGWGNLFINRDSAFDPAKDEHGPWALTLDLPNADTVTGLGLPFRWHVSTFVVFQRQVMVTPPTDGDETGTDATVLARLANVETELAALKRILQQWTGD